MNISKLLKIEYQKFSQNSIIRLLVILYFIFLPIAIFMAKEFDNLPEFLISQDNIFTFLEDGINIWDFMGYIGNWMVFFFLGVVAVYLVAIEVTNKTMRQSIINGLTRQEYFLSKLASITLISIIASLYYAFCTLVIGFIHTEGASLSLAFDNDWAIPRYFLMSMGYLSFALLIAVLVRKPALAVFLYLTYVLLIEVVLRYMLQYLKVPVDYTRLFPMNMVEDMHPFPMFKIPAANMGPGNIDEMLLSYTTATGGTLIYTVLFIFLAYRLFIKTDI